MTTREPRSAFEIIASTLPGWPDPAVAIAGSRAGATGLLDLEHAADPEAAASAVARLARFGRGSLGVKLRAGSPVGERLGPELPSPINVVVLTARDPASLPAAIARVRAPGRRILVECSSLEAARAARASGADGLVAKGHEAGGHVGEETTFILVQGLRAAIDLPVVAHGGVGLHTAPACYVAGCRGVVVDVQLALARESTLPSRVREALERMEGDETLCVGGDVGQPFRVYRKPGMAGVEALQRLEASLAAEPAESAAERWREELEARIGWERPERDVWPVGQDAAFAARLARRFLTVAGIVDGLRAAVADHVELARAQRALDRAAPLARSHGTEYPILQGPMTRVSDTAAFAEAVARGGGLPFLALALLRGPQVRTLLEEVRAGLGDRPWGVGILGFVPVELRQEQLEVIHDVRPRFAIIAGGRPDQAAQLEARGVATYLHVPAPGLLRAFLEGGARRFIFEGRECGGHVGPRTSFVLWQTMVDVLVDAIDAGMPADPLHVVFAGGIHDDLSAAMVAAIAAPLSQRGARVGVLLGTAYLFTEEAVAANAIVEGFQQEALSCTHTVRLESGPGHSTRCVDTPFHETFRQAKRRLVAEGRPPEEVRAELEALNLGRLRIASKGIARDPGADPSRPRYVEVDAERQHREGMFMIGQLAALRREVCRVGDLHESVSAGSARRLERTEPPAPATRPAVGAKMPSDVAIIGMGCLLPQAQDVPTFWRNVLGKVDAITEVPKERFDVDLYYDPDRKARDKVYSRWGGFLEDVPFDPTRYGIPPAALPSIDSAQLLALEVVRQALADAGYLDREFARERTSVILGLSGGLGDLGLGYGIRANLPTLLGPTPADVLRRLPEWTEDSFAGILLNVAAGRVANRFDLGGVNYTVDAACASSLAAVYLAVSELEAGTSDMVVVGGVDTVQSPFGFLCFSKSQALSPRGRCRTFDAGADGIAISEGLAVLVLKRRADAERDGDRVYAVIRGVAGSSDGRGRSLTAPRPEGQTLALERAYARAGVSPATVGLIEAHGTGTVVGDAAEVAALTDVFLAAGAAPSSCAIGSVKSMVGHTKSAAGVTGLMKVALALHHKVLPPTLHVETPNPKLREADNPFFVNTEPVPWMPAEAGAPRRAGVSAFGFGGTNFHAVLEEHVDDYADPAARRTSEAWAAELFVWNGTSAEGLEASLAELEGSLERGARPLVRGLAATVCAAAAAEGGRGVGGALRLAIVAADLEDLRGKLGLAREALKAGRSRLQDPRGVYLGPGDEAPGKLAFLFPGQGSQAPHMLRDLALHFPQLRQACEEADRVLEGRLPQRLSAYIFPPPAFTPAEQSERMEAITDTEVAQPALGAVEIGLLHVLASLGIRPDMVAGHSYGEYVALAAAGALSERALVEISAARGRVIKEAVGESPGTMAAVLAGADKVADALRDVPEVWLANFNAPEQTIIAGAPARVEAAARALESAGLRSRPIPVACAFHSPLMEGARGRLAEALARLDLSSPRLPVFSNAHAAPYPAEPRAVASVLSEHLVRPVRFLDEVRAMHDSGARVFLEVGPKSVLAGLTRQILEGRDAVVLATDVPDRDGLVQLLHTVAQLAVAGVPVKLDRLFERRQAVRPDAPGEVAPAWVVNGAGARPAARAGAPSRPVALQARRAPAPAAAPSAPPVTSAPPASLVEIGRSAPGATAPPPDAVMLQFQDLMSQFLKTQAAVMTAYLQGGGPGRDALVAPPLPVAAAAPEVPAAPPPEPPRPAPVAAAPPEAARRDVAAELLRIVGERTGYPPEMLRADVGIEADLGIDSIKRVEILSAFQGQCPAEEQPRVQAVMERLTAARTLREMSELLAGALEGGAPSPASGEAPVLSARDVPAELLALVGERTGYPVELLKLDSRIEADLGIDSIKRVEILSEFQRRSSADAQRRLQAVMERLTAARTLRELIAMLGESLAGDPASRGEARPAPEAARDEAPEPAGSAEDVPRFTLQAVSAPLVRGQSRAFPGRVVLITDDGVGLAEGVASALRHAGERPVLLHHRPARTEARPGTYAADLTSPDDIAAVIDEVRRAHGAPGAILHLLPLQARAGFDGLGIDSWRGRVQADIKTLYGLIHAAHGDLNAAGRAGGAMIVAATGLGASLAGGASPVEPTHGGVAAMLKTVAAEMPDVGCRAVHLGESEAPDERAAHVLAELGVLDGPTEVAYSGPRRLAVVPAPAPLPPVGTESPVSSDWVFLVTGGARGITAEVAAYLAAAFRPTLVLAGLSPVPPDEAKETAAIADPQALKAALTAKMRAADPAVKPSAVEAAWLRVLRDREIRRNLASLREAGARVEYHSVDVRDETAFGGLIDEIYRTYGRLDAVIHGAGIIEDKLLKDKAADSFDRVVHTKTDSAFTLVRRVRPEGLKLLVFMSSVTAAFGNRGQADYGAANGVLNALAALLSRQWPGRVLALNWGPWDKTGMVSEHVRRQFANRGIQVIPVPSGVAALAREIAAGRGSDAVVVLGGGPWAAGVMPPRALEVTA